MLRVTLRGLLEHKIRFFLTTFAVVIGVGFVVGTLVLTDSVRAQFDQLFTDINKGIDLQVRGTSQFEQGAFGTNPPVAESLLPTIQALPGVQSAGGNAGGFPALLIDPNGEPVKPIGGPPLAITWTPGSPNTSLTAKEGGPPQADDEVALDVDLADRGKAKVGDTVTVQTAKGPGQYKVVGIFSFGTSNSTSGATLIAFTLPEAQRLYNLEGKVSSIDVAVESGTSTDTVKDEISAVLPPGTEVITAAQLISENQSDVGVIVDIFGNILLGFAGITLFVSAFLISNTFTIVVGQRVRELALLRAVGATPSQIARSVLGEALAVGIVATVVGMALGIAIALGLNAVLSQAGLGTDDTSLVLTPRSFIAAAAVGVIVTLLSAIAPAWKATTVPPVAAMRDGFTFRGISMRTRGIAGGIMVVIGGAGLAWALFGKPDTPLLLLGMIGGALLIFLGVAILSPAVVGPIAHVVAIPFRLFQTPGRLAEENAARNPRRTASTASALMIGLALVTTALVVGTSIKQSLRSTIGGAVTADWFVSTGAFYGFDPAVAKSLRALPELAAVTSLRQGQVQVNGSTKTVNAVDFDTLPAVVDIDLKQGTLQAGAHGVLVYKDPAKDQDLHVGDQVHLLFNDTGEVTVPVIGIYDDASVVGNWVIDIDTFSHNTTAQLDTLVIAKTRSGVDAADARSEIEKVLAPYPDLKLQDRKEFTASQVGQLDALLAVVNVFLLLAIFIAFFGITNTLALSVFERTRELGLLRAVGMSRRQLKRMVRLEAVIVAVFGAALGVIVGLVFGVAVTSALPSNFVSSISVPVPVIIVLVILSGLVGVLAAIWPARRAGRLDVLDAIAHE
jgi:putative ABC transport system permease protein